MMVIIAQRKLSYCGHGSIHSRGKLSGPEGKTKHVSKEVAIISVCVIGIWGMAQGVAPANIQQCVQTKPCVQIYS